MYKFRVGVIGLGFGQQHVKTLAHMAEANLVAVADSSASIAEGMDSYAARYGATAYGSSLEMLENEDLDAVSVCTSPVYREEIIEQIAKRRIPMFIEKPWATNLEHARNLAALCRTHNATVMVGFSFRFLPAIVRLRELIEGELGKGRMLNGEYAFSWLPPADHWLWDPENGNGFFNENSCHLFDAICYLLGKPTFVMAEGGNFSGSPSQDAAAISMRFESGAIAAVTVGGLGTAADLNYPRIDLMTESGQAHLRGRHHIWESLTWAETGDTETRSFIEPPEILGSTRYTHAFRHFFECIRTGTIPSATIEDGILSVAIAEAVYESARTGRKVQVD